MKPYQLAIQAAVAVAVIGDCLINARIKRACTEVSESNDQLHQINEILVGQAHDLTDALQTADKRVDYLVNLLAEHNVPATEFDMIVLNNLV